MPTKGEQTREHIMDVSYALFAEKGFKQVTMKDVCGITDMSRGGLYSHFSSTKELFEAILERKTSTDEMNFEQDIKNNVPATTILENVLKHMEDEMNHPEDSLTAAIYEYGEVVDSQFMETLNKKSIKRWSALIKYGIKNGEFQDVDVDEVVNIILYSYQGVRMWSRIVPMKKKVTKSITDHIRSQLIGGKND